MRSPYVPTEAKELVTGFARVDHVERDDGRDRQSRKNRSLAQRIRCGAIPLARNAPSSISPEDAQPKKRRRILDGKNDRPRSNFAEPKRSHDAIPIHDPNRATDLLAA